MCHLVYDLSSLVEGLQSPRGLAGLLSDMAPSMCRFWFSGGQKWRSSDYAETQTSVCLCYSQATKSGFLASRLL